MKTNKLGMKTQHWVAIGVYLLVLILLLANDKLGALVLLTLGAAGWFTFVTIRVQASGAYDYVTRTNPMTNLPETVRVNASEMKFYQIAQGKFAIGFLVATIAIVIALIRQA
jgi:hypothetical protein